MSGPSRRPVHGAATFPEFVIVNAPPTAAGNVIGLPHDAVVKNWERPTDGGGGFNQTIMETLSNPAVAIPLALVTGGASGVYADASLAEVASAYAGDFGAFGSEALSNVAADELSANLTTRGISATVPASIPDTTGTGSLRMDEWDGNSFGDAGNIGDNINYADYSTYDPSLDPYYQVTQQPAASVASNLSLGDGTYSLSAEELAANAADTTAFPQSSIDAVARAEAARGGVTPGIVDRIIKGAGGALQRVITQPGRPGYSQTIPTVAGARVVQTAAGAVLVDAGGHIISAPGQSVIQLPNGKFGVRLDSNGKIVPLNADGTVPGSDFLSQYAIPIGVGLLAAKVLLFS